MTNYTDYILALEKAAAKVFNDRSLRDIIAQASSENRPLTSVEQEHAFALLLERVENEDA